MKKKLLTNTKGGDMGFVKAIMYGLNEISKSENTVPIAKAVGISSMAIMLMIEKTMKIVAKND